MYMRLGYLGVIALVLVVINGFLISRFFKVTAPTSSTTTKQDTNKPMGQAVPVDSSVPGVKFTIANEVELQKRITDLGIYRDGAQLLKTKERVPVSHIKIELVYEPQPINLMMQTDATGKATSKHNFNQEYDASTKTLTLKVYTSPYIDVNDVDKQYSMAVALALFESAQTPPTSKEEQDQRTQRWLQYTQEFNNSGGLLVKRI